MSARRIVGSFLFAFVWVVAATLRPTATFHLAPVIVAAWPALGERVVNRAAAASVAGFAIAAATTVLLSMIGLLDGPSLLPWGGPAAESVVAAAMAAAVAVVPATMTRPTSVPR